MKCSETGFTERSGLPLYSLVEAIRPSSELSSGNNVVIAVGSADGDAHLCAFQLCNSLPQRLLPDMDGDAEAHPSRCASLCSTVPASIQSAMTADVLRWKMLT